MEFGRMLPIIAFTDKANGGSMGQVKLFCLYPDPELFAKNHAQEPKQCNDGRGWAFYPDKPVDNANTETDCERNEQYLHLDSS
jgi:hypothetical protein